MKHASTLQAIAGLLLLLLGTFALLRIGLQAPQRFTSISRNVETMEQLNILGSRIEASRFAREKLEADGTTRPPELEALVRRVLGEAATVHPQPARDLGNGWELARAEIRFAAAPWSSMTELIQQLEQTQPGWLPTAANLEAGPTQTTSGLLRVQATRQVE